MRRLTLLCGLVSSGLAFGQFTPGNLVVRLVGDGDSVVTGAIPTSLREYNLVGTQVGTVVSLNNLPGGGDVCNSYGETSEGALELSDDGKYLMVSGYDIPARDALFDAFLTNRVIGRINVATKAVELSMRFVPALGDGLRGLWSSNSDRYIVTGGDIGLLDGTFGTSPSNPVPGTVSSRNIHLYNGLWYFNSSNGGPNGANGMVTWDGSTTTPLFATPNGASSRNFAFLNPTTLYLCTSTGTQGLMKIQSDGFGNWNLLYQLGGTGVNSIVVDGSDIYVTHSNGSTIMETTDTGTGFSAYTAIATADANTRFRGMVKVPAPSVTTETLAPTSEQILLGTTGSGGNLASWASNDGNIRNICKFFVPFPTSPFIRANLNYTTTKAAEVRSQITPAIAAVSFCLSLLRQKFTTLI